MAIITAEPERYGTRLHQAYQWEIIEIATPTPILKNLLWPLSVQVQPQFSTRVPALEFSSVVSYGNNSRDNVRLTAQQLEPKLGKARIAERYKAISVAIRSQTSTRTGRYTSDC